MCIKAFDGSLNWADRLLLWAYLPSIPAQMAPSSGQNVCLQRFSSLYWDFTVFPFSLLHYWFVHFHRHFPTVPLFIFSGCFNVTKETKEENNSPGIGSFICLSPVLYVLSYSDRWIWRSLSRAAAHAWKDGHYCSDKDAESRPKGTAEERVSARGVSHWTVQQRQHHQAGGSGHQE